MDSLWSITAKRPQFPPLEQDIRTDVLIIGGGITGILCAYLLREAGIHCVLAEADQICSGITQNTTAKLTVQHGLIYDRILRRYGLDTAKGYYGAQHASLQRYRALCRQIPCDFTECSNVVYGCSDRKKLEREAAVLEQIGCPSAFMERVPLPFPTVGAVRTSGQAHFHPLKFAYTIAKDLPIFEQTKITELQPGLARTERGVIRAENMIITTHFPLLNKHGAYFLKLYQHRSYVIALENGPILEDMYVDEDTSGFSFRPYGQYLLLGGGGHRTGKQGGAWRELTSFAGQQYPEAREVCRWATQDCMSLDGIPYIGQYSPRTPHLYVASGFNKWGMTSAMTASVLLRDQLLGRENPWAWVFAPNRSILHPQLAVNAFHSCLGLVTPTTPRCPHMGCALHYNPAEHSWDCACHGSRFTEEGKRLNGPATGDRK